MKLTDAELAAIRARDARAECAGFPVDIDRRALLAHIEALEAECDQWKLGSATVNGRLLDRIAVLEEWQRIQRDRLVNDLAGYFRASPLTGERSMNKQTHKCDCEPGDLLAVEKQFSRWNEKYGYVWCATHRHWVGFTFDPKKMMVPPTADRGGEHGSSD